MSCGDAQVDEILPGASQVDQYLELLDGKAVALTVNHSSRVGEVHLVDRLLEEKVNVERIFAPEHGFRGEADDGATIKDERDKKTGLPIISLYGKNKKPSVANLEGTEVMIFDIQDVGARFYTFISTMHLVMEACAEQGIPVIVLDRPNPNGYYIDGPVLDPKYRSFVGMHEIPIVYGMTIGELAQMINGEGWLEGGVQCDLTVVPCANYDHTMTYDLPVAPSPNLPNLRSVLLYPSLCLFEGTVVSVGRGTDKQFQVLGHPNYDIGGYVFTPEPKPGASSPPHNGKKLYGIDLSQYSVDEVKSWRSLNLSWLIEYYDNAASDPPLFLENKYFDKLAGTDMLRKQIEQGWSEYQIRESWQEGIAAFKQARSKYLLYPDFE